MVHLETDHHGVLNVEGKCFKQDVPLRSVIVSKSPARNTQNTLITVLRQTVLEVEAMAAPAAAAAAAAAGAGAGTATASVEAAILAVCRRHDDGGGASDAVLEAELPAGLSLEARAVALNRLLEKRLLKVYQQHSGAGGALLYREQDPGEAAKLQGLGSEELLVYQVMCRSWKGLPTA